MKIRVPLNYTFFFWAFSREMQLVYYSIPQSPARSPGIRKTLLYWVSFLLLCCKGNKKHLVLVSPRSHTTRRRSFPQSLVHRECWWSLATLNEDISIGIPWMPLADQALEKPLRKNDFTDWLLQGFLAQLRLYPSFWPKLSAGWGWGGQARFQTLLPVVELVYEQWL